MEALIDIIISIIRILLCSYIIYKVIKGLVIGIRCKFNSNFKHEYENKKFHKYLQNEFKIYYGKISKKKYEHHEYIKKVLDKYEPWRNPKE